MVKKIYDWVNGATLDEHSRRKHKILREYLLQYLLVRCKLPQQAKFRIAIVDGFAGGGRYKCGAPGSPIIFVEQVQIALDQINLERAVQNLSPIDVEFLLIVNDADAKVTELLRGHLSPVLAAAKENAARLSVETLYFSRPFEDVYPEIKSTLRQRRFKNVLFNLDQCGHSYVEKATLIDIIQTFQAEIFYTFAIQSLLTFLNRRNPDAVRAQLGFLGLRSDDLGDLQVPMSNEVWLGAAERLVFDAFHDCAPYVSPFSINNPDGWRYWFIHFAKSYRARQVYNNVLHDNATLQAHFGRAGLNMLSYDARHHDGRLYLFDEPARSIAAEQLLTDIPKLVSSQGRTMPIIDFYESVYKLTPAHASDIHVSLLNNPELKVLTTGGGQRRAANTIKTTDLIQLEPQKTFFHMPGFGRSEASH